MDASSSPPLSCFTDLRLQSSRPRDPSTRHRTNHTMFTSLLRQANAFLGTHFTSHDSSPSPHLTSPHLTSPHLCLPLPLQSSAQPRWRQGRWSGAWMAVACCTAAPCGAASLQASTRPCVRAHMHSYTHACTHAPTHPCTHEFSGWTPRHAMKQEGEMRVGIEQWRWDLGGEQGLQSDLPYGTEAT